MDNVLQDMVQRLRAIELLLRTQNELLTSVLVEPEQNKRCAEASGCSRPCSLSDEHAGKAASAIEYRRNIWAAMS